MEGLQAETAYTTLRTEPSKLLLVASVLLPYFHAATVTLPPKNCQHLNDVLFETENLKN